MTGSHGARAKERIYHAHLSPACNQCLKRLSQTRNMFSFSVTVTLEPELEQKVGWSSVVWSVYCSKNVKRGGKGRKWSQHPRPLGNPGNSSLADQIDGHFRRGKWSLGKVYQRSSLFIGITTHTHTHFGVYKKKPHIDLGEPG